MLGFVYHFSHLQIPRHFFYRLPISGHSPPSKKSTGYAVGGLVCASGSVGICSTGLTNLILSAPDLQPVAHTPQPKHLSASTVALYFLLPSTRAISIALNRQRSIHVWHPVHSSTLTYARYRLFSQTFWMGAFIKSSETEVSQQSRQHWQLVYMPVIPV